MKILAVADIHGMISAFEEIALRATKEKPDMILIAGDIIGGSLRCRPDRVEREMKNLVKIANCDIVVTPGNHDHPQVMAEGFEWLSSCHLLVNDEISFDTDSGAITIFGTPWTPQFGNWHFMKPESELEYAIPPEADILLSHGPPLGYGDMSCYGDRIGSVKLRDAIQRSNVRHVICGHNHHQGGQRFPMGDRTVYNVAVLDDDYVFHPERITVIEI